MNHVTTGAMAIRVTLAMALLLALSGLSKQPAAIAQQVTYSGSVQLASGSYIFTERTTSVYFFNGLQVSTDKLSASFSVPLIYQNSPWITYGITGGLPSGGTENGTVNVWRKGRGKGQGAGGTNTDAAIDDPVVVPDTTSYADFGIGDPSIHASYELVEDAGRLPSISISGNLKLPIADVDQGFGTGAADFGGGVMISKSLGRTFLFADVMYWWLGDLSELDLNNPVSYSLSIGHTTLSGKVGWMVAFAGFTTIIPDVDPPMQASVGVSYFVNQNVGLSTSFAAGLSESAADYAISAGWTLKL